VRKSATGEPAAPGIRLRARQYGEKWSSPPACSAQLRTCYLAFTNVRAQQTPGQIDPGRPDDLYEPLDDRGAHGPFDAEAKPRSLAFELRAALTRGGRRVRGE
jgi:hypothetical protein